MPYLDIQVSLDKNLNAIEKRLRERVAEAATLTQLKQTDFVTLYEPNPLSISKAQIRTFAVFNE